MFFSQERSECSKAAVSMIVSSSGSFSVASKLSEQQQKDMMDSRHTLSMTMMMIFTSLATSAKPQLRFLGCQALTIRGKQTKHPIYDSYLNSDQLIQLLSETDFSEISTNGCLLKSQMKKLEMFSFAALRELIN